MHNLSQAPADCPLPLRKQPIRGKNRRSGLPQLFIVSILVILLLLLSAEVLSVTPAVAAVQQFEESPGQFLYQSRQPLRDQFGNHWQAIAFKRIQPNGNSPLHLRLVGFPGIVEIDHAQPLTLVTSLGQSFTISDLSQDLFQEKTPEPNVAQYLLENVLPQLQSELPLRLKLPTTSGQAIVLKVPPVVVQEWQSIAVQV